MGADDHHRDIAAVSQIDSVPTMLATVCRATGMRFAAVARVTDQRWIACSVHDQIAFGLVPGGELELESTICHEIRQCGDPVVIADVASDPTYHGHHTPARYGFRSYVSVPIWRADGVFFGTLCALDPEPRLLGKVETLAMFEMFASLIGAQLDQADRLVAAESRISQQRQESELREQFIAVLGHDLRSPLANVQAGISLLRRKPAAPPERAEMVLDNMVSSVERMARLIDNVLDFARGRLGGGLTLQRAPTAIAPLVRQVLGEFANSHPERPITLGCTSDMTLSCDPMRMAQLLSNLVGNAVTHGAVQEPVLVRCFAQSRELVLSVSNGGAPIPEDARALLFHPFARGKVSRDQQGLGLGLYIASQIAEAHGGALTVTSNPDRTTFTFTMPLI